MNREQLTSAKFWAMDHLPGFRYIIWHWSALTAACGVYRAVWNFHRNKHTVTHHGGGSFTVTPKKGVSE